MILRVFFLLIVSQALRPPKFKWAQDKHYVYLTIFATCTNEKKKLIISRASFRLECDVATLDLTLRDDIDPTGSICEVNPHSDDSQFCKIKKKHDFIYDRLTESITELEQLKGILSVDYDRMGTLGLDDDEGNHNVYGTPLEINFKKTSVVEITDQNLKNMMKNKLLFVVTSYPLCDWCRDFMREFIKTKTAEILEKKFPNFRFGFADAVNNPKLRHQVGVQCVNHYQCNATLFKSGVPYTIELANVQAERFEAFFSSFLRPWSTDIGSFDSLEEFVESNEYALVFFSKENRTIEPKILFTVLISGASCGTVHGSAVKDALDFPDNSIILFKNELEKNVVFDDLLLPEAVHRFLMREKWELVEDWQWRVTDDMQRIGIPCAILFLRETNHELLVFVETVAQNFRGQLGFVLGSPEDMSEIFGYIHHTFPLLVIGDNFEKDAMVYQYDGDSFESEKLTQFCQNFLDKKISSNLRMRMSEMSPAEPFQSGEIRKLVQKTWEREVINNTETDILVMTTLFYDNFGYRKVIKWKNILTKIASYLKDVHNTMVASYSFNDNYLDTELFSKKNINGDETGAWIWLFPSGRIRESKPILYEHSTSQKKLLLWLKKRAPRIKAAWGNIKASIKKIQNAIEKDKILVSEKINTVEEKLEKIEKIDISGDGGIIKHIIHAGEGNITPFIGAKISAHYTGRLLSGKKFDSSVDRGQPFEFELGKGNVIKCWDRAFATMKKLEKAMLTCREDYAYGSMTQGPIPAGSTLKFEVELLSWIGEKSQSNGYKDEL